MKVDLLNSLLTIINDQSFENKVQIIEIVLEAVRKYERMNHCKSKSRKKASIT